jgi:hypothetical protein
MSRSWIVEHPKDFWGIYLYDDTPNYEIISDGKWYINACSPVGRQDICSQVGQHDLLPSYYFIRTTNDKAFLIVSERFDEQTLVRKLKENNPR